MHESFEHIPFAEAVEFLDSLRLLSRGGPRGQVRRHMAKRWVFRGHGDADWKLRPSALRPGTPFPQPGDRGTKTWVTVEEQVARYKRLAEAQPEKPILKELSNPDVQQRLVEFGALTTFFQAVDAAGLELPEDSQVIRDRLRSAPLPDTWPDLILRSILALAQHHGIPTRLLDWTWDWRIAALFAARDNLGVAAQGPDELAAWCLDAEDLEWKQPPAVMDLPAWKGREPPAGRDYALRLVTAPSATNLNLRSQRGLFTLLEIYPGAQSKIAPSVPLEELPPQPLYYSAEKLENLRLTKLTLPRSQAAELLRLLAMEGATSVTAFPDYRGVAQTLKDRAFWDRQVSDSLRAEIFGWRRPGPTPKRPGSGADDKA